MDKLQSFTTADMDEDSEYESMDPYSGYSDTEKYEHYLQIFKTIHFFESNGHVTEDWMQHHMWVIEKWRDWIFDYSEVNPEITEKEFRKVCNETETLITYLIHSIRTTKTFDTRVYHILLTKMKYICDNIFDADELAGMMSSMYMA